ncbi:hypothetical protein [Rhizobium sp. SGZ-381]|uniref:hypothetical protein n=1 Tax=Rhizobium sp. SGZ-381 TaxID=3342800 RepID=UPI00366CBA5A
MSAYKFENLDGGLALVSVSNPDICEWIAFEIGSFPSAGVVAARVALCDGADSNLFAFDVEGAADIRTEMTEWLEDNGYSVSIPCDYRCDDRKTAAPREAQALRDRFLGDYAPLDALWCASWVSEDGQGSMYDDGHAERPDPAAFVAELLDVCGDTAHDRKGILAGRINLTRYRGHWNRGPEVLEVEDFDAEDFAPLPAAA